MKKTLVIAALTLLLAMAVGSAYAYEAFHGPSETIYWDPTKAANGYSIMGGNLIDMDGTVVYKLKCGGRLYEDGTCYGEGGTDFVKKDWDGNVIFDLEETRSNYHPHHDSILVKNKKLGRDTVIYIANKDLTHDQIIAAGANPAWSAYTSGQMDCLVERDSLDNKVVWEWCMYDHLIQDLDPTKNNYVAAGKKISDYPGKMNINFGSPVKNDWNHMNGLDYNDANGHIVFDEVRGEMWIIDHDGTFVSSAANFTADATAALAANVASAASANGDFLWRFGDPAMYQQGIAPSINSQTWTVDVHDKQMGTTHDAQWIRNLSSKIGVPGAGNILIFNDGGACFDQWPQSGAIEVNPYIKGLDTASYPVPGRNVLYSSSYVNPPVAGYYNWQRRSDFGANFGTYKVSNQVVWFFRNRETSGSATDNGGNLIRLWNGNTLLSIKTEGHYYEVTPGGEVVWEYVNPTTPKGILSIIPPGMLDQHTAGRIWRYPYDFPVFKGKNIYPMGTLTGRTPYRP